MTDHNPSSRKCGFCGRRGLHACLDREVADYSRTPGTVGVLRFGSLEFYANTADSGAIGFGFSLAGRNIGWTIEGAE